MGDSYASDELKPKALIAHPGNRDDLMGLVWRDSPVGSLS
jgi:hypothetical protein